VFRQDSGDITRNRIGSSCADFPVDSYQLILGQTDSDLRLGHTIIIPPVSWITWRALRSDAAVLALPRLSNLTVMHTNEGVLSRSRTATLLGRMVKNRTLPWSACLAVNCLFASCFLMLGQQQLNNEAVSRLAKAGLSDDLIISTVNAAPGSYDTSADGLISLKSAGLSDRVISAIVLKVSSTPIPPPPPIAPMPSEQAGQHYVASLPVSSTPNATPGKPRVFLQSASKGTNRNANRDQSMEMSKDIERDCPDVRVTVNQQAADYTILLNHIEVGFVRDNQIQIANKDGDLLSKTKEGGSIAGGMKKACALIAADWAKK
jgi:hypothetical protein